MNLIKILEIRIPKQPNCVYDKNKKGGWVSAIQGIGGWNKHKDKYEKVLQKYFKIVNRFEDCGFVFMTFEKN